MFGLHKIYPNDPLFLSSVHTETKFNIQAKSSRKAGKHKNKYMMLLAVHPGSINKTDTLSKKILMLITATYFLPSTGLLSCVGDLYLWCYGNDCYYHYYSFNCLHYKKAVRSIIRPFGPQEKQPAVLSESGFWQEPTFEGIFTLTAQTATLKLLFF